MYKIPRRLDHILDDCLLRMDRGESLIDILAVYPVQADKLKPLLLVAMLSRALPQPVPGYTALRVGKNQMLAEMASMQAEDSFIKPKPAQPPRERVVDRWIGSLIRLQLAYRFAMLALVVILAGGFFTLSASASGLADNIMQTLFFGFEQVGDLLLIKPSPPKALGENPILTSEYDLPGSPPDYSGDFKGLMVDDEKSRNKTDQLSEELLAQIETRVHTFVEKYEEEADLVDEVIDDEEVAVLDEEKEEDDDKEEKEADLVDEVIDDEEVAVLDEEKEEDDEKDDDKDDDKEDDKEDKEDDKDKD